MLPGEVSRVSGSDQGGSTAYLHWDEQWRDLDSRAAWSSPEPWVAQTVQLLTERGARRTLDLGCGVGRHSLFLAAQGFDCTAMDRSTAGVDHARRRAMESALDVTFLVGSFDALPFADGSFDYVLAWNVVYHGDERLVRTAAAEVIRVLRPGGVYQATMLSKRNSDHGRGVEVSRNTWVQPDAADDKIHPHVYCDAGDMLRLHDGLALLAAFDEPHGRPGSHHWHLLFERAGGSGEGPG
ncbi:MAG: methyltransferase domain-containing protein [Streptosporangiales bacterium]|nr:methyltransferase domain-containing protein [Streptosporangiales bacterium]